MATCPVFVSAEITGRCGNVADPGFCTIKAVMNKATTCASVCDVCVHVCHNNVVQAY